MSESAEISDGIRRLIQSEIDSYAQTIPNKVTKVIESNENISYILQDRGIPRDEYNEQVQRIDEIEESTTECTTMLKDFVQNLKDTVFSECKSLMDEIVGPISASNQELQSVLNELSQKIDATIIPRLKFLEERVNETESIVGGFTRALEDQRTELLGDIKTHVDFMSQNIDLNQETLLSNIQTREDKMEEDIQQRTEKLTLVQQANDENLHKLIEKHNDTTTKILDRHTENINELNQKMANLEQKTITDNEQIDQRTTAIAEQARDLEKMTKSHSKQLKELESSQSQIQRSLEATNAQAKQSLDTFTEIKVQFGSLTKKQEDTTFTLNQEVQRLESENEKLLTRIRGQIASEVSTIESTLSTSLAAKTEERDTQLRLQQEKLSADQNTLDSLKQKLEATKTMNATSMDEFKTQIKAVHKENKKEVAELIKVVNTTVSSLASVAAQIESLNAAIQKVSSNNDNIESAVMQQVETLLQQTETGFNDQIKSLSDSHQAQISEAGQQIEELQKNIDHLVADVNQNNRSSKEKTEQLKQSITSISEENSKVFDQLTKDLTAIRNGFDESSVETKNQLKQLERRIKDAIKTSTSNNERINQTLGNLNETKTALLKNAASIEKQQEDIIGKQEKAEQKLRDHIEKAKTDIQTENSQSNTEILNKLHFLETQIDTLKGNSDMDIPQLVETLGSVQTQLSEYQKSTEEIITASKTDIASKNSELGGKIDEITITLRSEIKTMQKATTDELHKQMAEEINALTQKIKELWNKIDNLKGGRNLTLPDLVQKLKENETYALQLQKDQKGRIAQEVTRITAAINAHKENSKKSLDDWHKNAKSGSDAKSSEFKRSVSNTNSRINELKESVERNRTALGTIKEQDLPKVDQKLEQISQTQQDLNQKLAEIAANGRNVQISIDELKEGSIKGLNSSIDELSQSIDAVHKNLSDIQLKHDTHHESLTKEIKKVFNQHNENIQTKSDELKQLVDQEQQTILSNLTSSINEFTKQQQIQQQLLDRYKSTLQEIDSTSKSELQNFSTKVNSNITDISNLTVKIQELKENEENQARAIKKHSDQLNVTVQHTAQLNATLSTVQFDVQKLQEQSKQMHEQFYQSFDTATQDTKSFLEDKLSALNGKLALIQGDDSLSLTDLTDAIKDIRKVIDANETSNRELTNDLDKRINSSMESVDQKFDELKKSTDAKTGGFEDELQTKIKDVQGALDGAIVNKENKFTEAFSNLSAQTTKIGNKQQQTIQKLKEKVHTIQEHFETDKSQITKQIEELNEKSEEIQSASTASIDTIAKDTKKSFDSTINDLKRDFERKFKQMQESIALLKTKQEKESTTLQTDQTSFIASIKTKTETFETSHSDLIEDIQTSIRKVDGSLKDTEFKLNLALTEQKQTITQLQQKLQEAQQIQSNQHNQAVQKIQETQKNSDSELQKLSKAIEVETKRSQENFSEMQQQFDKELGELQTASVQTTKEQQSRLVQLEESTNELKQLMSTTKQETAATIEDLNKKLNGIIQDTNLKVESMLNGKVDAAVKEIDTLRSTLDQNSQQIGVDFARVRESVNDVNDNLVQQAAAAKANQQQLVQALSTEIRSLSEKIERLEEESGLVKSTSENTKKDLQRNQESFEKINQLEERIKEIDALREKVEAFDKYVSSVEGIFKRQVLDILDIQEEKEQNAIVEYEAGSHELGKFIRHKLMEHNEIVIHVDQANWETPIQLQPGQKVDLIGKSRNDSLIKMRTQSDDIKCCCVLGSGSQLTIKNVTIDGRLRRTDEEDGIIRFSRDRNSTRQASLCLSDCVISINKHFVNVNGCQHASVDLISVSFNGSMRGGRQYTVHPVVNISSKRGRCILNTRSVELSGEDIAWDNDPSIENI